MTLEELLKAHPAARLSVQSAWLVWYTDEWIVYARKPYAKQNPVVYRGDDLERALDKLAEYNR